VRWEVFMSYNCVVFVRRGGEDGAGTRGEQLLLAKRKKKKHQKDVGSTESHRWAEN